MGGPAVTRAGGAADKEEFRISVESPRVGEEMGEGGRGGGVGGWGMIRVGVELEYVLVIGEKGGTWKRIRGRGESTRRMTATEARLGVEEGEGRIGAGWDCRSRSVWWRRWDAVKGGVDMMAVMMGREVGRSWRR